jgi:hypothetical protein
VAVLGHPVEIAVDGGQGRPMSGGRDDEIDVNFGSGNCLERFLDQAGEAVLEPILSEFARYADAECRTVG